MIGETVEIPADLNLVQRDRSRSNLNVDLVMAIFGFRMLKKRRRLVELAKRCILWRFQGGYSQPFQKMPVKVHAHGNFSRWASGAEEVGSKLGRLGLKLKTRTSL